MKKLRKVGTRDGTGVTHVRLVTSGSDAYIFARNDEYDNDEGCMNAVELTRVAEVRGCSGDVITARAGCPSQRLGGECC